MIKKIAFSGKIAAIIAAIVLIFVFAVGAYVDTHSDAIWREFKFLLENKLSKSLGVSVSIGSAEGGIFRCLILRNLSVAQKNKDGIMLPVFDAGRVDVGTNLWDMLFDKDKEIKTISLVSPKIFLRPVRRTPRSSTGKVMNSFLLTRAKDKALRSMPLKMLIKDGEIYAGAKEPLVKSLQGLVRYDGKKINFDNVEGFFIGMPFEVEGVVYDLDASPQIMLYADLKGEKISGGLAAWDLIENPCIGGKIDFGKILVRFGGKVGIENKEVVIDDFYVGQKRSKNVYNEVNNVPQIRLSYEFLGKGEGITNISLKHIDLWGSDLYSHLEVKSKIDPKAGTTSFDILSSGTMIDLRPFLELESSFKLDKNGLDIACLKLGNNLNVQGTISKKKPQSIDMKISVNNTSMDQILSTLYGNSDSSVTGIISGEIKIKGPLLCPKIKGRFEAREGNLGELVYESGSINIEGLGNRVMITDSRINSKDTWYRFEGGMDLKDLKSNPLSGLRLVSEEGIVVWEGWEVGGSGRPKLSLGQSDDFNLGINKYMNEPIPIFGIQHKHKF